MKQYNANRKGIALFLAIAFMLVMTTILGVMVSMTSTASKRASNVYFQEQAHLLAKSATEFAMLAISGHTNVPGNCIERINMQFPQTNPIYTINTNIRYIGLNCGGTADYITSIATPESNGTILVDVYVQTIAAATGQSEPVRFHRRTMQKP